MEDFKIEVEETKTYWERMKSLFARRFILVFACCLLLYFLPITDNKASNLQKLVLILLIYIPYSVILLLAYHSLCVCQISFIEITENRVHIIYKKRNKKLEVTDSIDNFIFKKGAGNKIVSSSSINITYKGEIIRQLDKWNWEEEKAFDQLLDYLTRRNLFKKVGFNS